MARKVMVEISKDFGSGLGNYYTDKVENFDSFDEAMDFVKKDIDRYFSRVNAATLEDLYVEEEHEENVTIIRIIDMERCDPVDYFIYET